jgi:hypothetical protein
MLGVPSFLNGIPVYIDDLLGWESRSEQVRFPRSKKRRIRKKFAKDSRNYRVRKWQEPVAYRMGGVLIVNSAMKSRVDSQGGAL